MFEHEAPSGRPGRSRLAAILAAVVILVAVLITGRLWAPAPGEHPVEQPPVATPSPAAVPVPPPSPPPSKDDVAATERAPRRRPTPSPQPVAPAETPVAVSGELRIETDVPGAMVFLDRQYLGTAPVTVHNVSPGSHHLNASAEGYDGYSEPIDVVAGPATVVIRFNEVRLNATLDVVHKHAIGSCEGRLVATPDGIAYETTNKSDAFSMKREDVESFEIDYLKKTLRVKKAGGKTYNFTTKAGSADPLFVFHRDVQKAWARMKAGGAK